MEEFLKAIKECSKKFNEWLKKYEIVRCISHLDCDGICSAAIICNLLKKLGKQFHITFLKQFSKREFDIIKNENYEFYIFTDLGSGQLHFIKELVSKAKVVILDHHQIKEKFEHENLLHLNPNEFGVDGSSEISSSGITALLSKEMGENEFFYLGVVGGVGDNQSFEGMNKMILEECVKKGTVSVRRDLKIIASRPLYKALEFSSFEIPGVSGNESKAVKFLSEIGIDIRNEDGSWKKLSDLNDEEKKKLTSAIIVKRAGLEDPSDIFGDVYEINNSFGNVSELATFLNACSRTGYSGIAFSIFFSKKSLPLANELMNEYRKKLVNALNFAIERNIIKENIIYVIGGDEIDSKIIGTIISMMINNSEKDIIVGFANDDDRVKVSARSKCNCNINLGEIVSQIAVSLGGEGGGHKKAAGASIPKGKEEEFINKFEILIKEKQNKDKEESFEIKEVGETTW